MSRHHNFNFSSGIPLYTNDRYYGQDRLRDFWFGINDSAKKIKALFDDFPILLENGEVSQGSSVTQINIGISRGIVSYTVTLPDAFAQPPTTRSEDISVFVESTAQTNLNISATATLDGVTTNYVKLQYNEIDGNTRARAKGSGAYAYEVLESFNFVVNSVAPTDFDMVLAELVGDGSTFLTINNRPELPIDRKFQLVSETGTLKNNRKYITENVIDLTLPSVSQIGDTLEIYTKDEVRILQQSSEQLITHKNSFFTTKGISGFLRLRSKNHVTMTYIGSGDSRIEPGVKLSAPATLPTTSPNDVEFSSDGIYLAVAQDTTPFVFIYKRSGDTFTKLSDPSTLPPGTVNFCRFSPNGIYLVVISNVTTFITIYKRSGDTFTKLSDPSPLPASGITGAAWSADSTYLLITGTIADGGLFIYKRSGDTFTRLTNPTLPTGTQLFGPSFSYDLNFFAVGSNASPFIHIYKRFGDSFIKLSNPGTLPTLNTNLTQFSNNGNFLMVVSDSTPNIIFYKIIGESFEAITIPSGTFPVTGAVAFAFNSRYIALTNNPGGGFSSSLNIYRIEGDSFIKVDDFASLPTSSAISVSISTDGKYTAIGESASPFLEIYKNVESANNAWEITEIDTTYDQDLEYSFE